MQTVTTSSTSPPEKSPSLTSLDIGYFTLTTLAKWTFPWSQLTKLFLIGLPGKYDPYRTVLTQCTRFQTLQIDLCFFEDSNSQQPFGTQIILPSLLSLSVDVVEVHPCFMTTILADLHLPRLQRLKYTQNDETDGNVSVVALWALNRIVKQSQCKLETLKVMVALGPNPLPPNEAAIGTIVRSCQSSLRIIRITAPSLTCSFLAGYSPGQGLESVVVENLSVEAEADQDEDSGGVAFEQWLATQNTGEGGKVTWAASYLSL